MKSKKQLDTLTRVIRAYERVNHICGKTCAKYKTRVCAKYDAKWGHICDDYKEGKRYGKK